MPKGFAFSGVCFYFDLFGDVYVAHCDSTLVLVCLFIMVVLLVPIIRFCRVEAREWGVLRVEVNVAVQFPCECLLQCDFWRECMEGLVRVLNTRDDGIFSDSSCLSTNRFRQVNYCSNFRPYFPLLVV